MSLKAFEADFKYYFDVIKKIKALESKDSLSIEEKEYLRSLTMNKYHQRMILFISGVIVQLWFNEISLSILIAISMILNMIVAGLFGILIPVSLKKFNIDPAIASSVLVTTITDVIGFLSFLGIGAYFFYN